MIKDEALKLALEALETPWNAPYVDGCDLALGKKVKAITAIKEALAQPELTKHEVENADDWSEWVCPDPKGYLMKCCDCGLVHEAEFGVVRYKSETEREDCDRVDDPNLQAVFRMRRSEQWSPNDTAHRAGGMPMEQPEQEPVAWGVFEGNLHDMFFTEAEAVEMAQLKGTHAEVKPLYTAPQRTWVGLKDEDKSLFSSWLDHKTDDEVFTAIEAKLKEKNR